MEVLQYISKFNMQSSLPEVVKLLKMIGVFSLTSASAERSFSCLKRVKTYIGSGELKRVKSYKGSISKFKFPDFIIWRGRAKALDKYGKHKNIKKINN
jgi:hypothetical protein